MATEKMNRLAELLKAHQTFERQKEDAKARAKAIVAEARERAAEVLAEAEGETSEIVKEIYALTQGAPVKVRVAGELTKLTPTHRERNGREQWYLRAPNKTVAEEEIVDLD
jgi:regulator of protease activity HflC (stomatin/prohibitin superfamily)